MGGILSLLQPPLDGALAAMAICIAAAYYFLVAQHRLALLPGIPVAPNNSYLFGWTTFSSSSFEILRLMDRLGPMVQGRALNRNVLSIRDPTLAKKVLKDVKGKGFFHNPAPKLIRQSTFSLDTGPEVISSDLHVFILLISVSYAHRCSGISAAAASARPSPPPLCACTCPT